MGKTYTEQLLDNLAIQLRGTGTQACYYKNIYTIRIILPEVLPLKVFAEDFYSWLESFPEISAEKEMVKFWLCKEGTADFYWKMINPSDQAKIYAHAIGTGPTTWISKDDLINKGYKTSKVLSHIDY